MTMFTDGEQARALPLAKARAGGRLVFPANPHERLAQLEHWSGQGVIAAGPELFLIAPHYRGELGNRPIVGVNGVVRRT